MIKNPKNVIDISIARAKNSDIKKQERIVKIKQTCFIFTILFLIGIGFYTYEPDITKPFLNAQKPVSERLKNGDVIVTISQDSSGHYVFIGEMNGKEVKFLLDTGATNVSVPTGVANYLDMPFGNTYYSTTANGKSLSYASKANEIKVGEIVMYDVKASVATGMEGDAILLGMSFLKSLSVTQENGKIFLTQKNRQQT